MSKKAQADFEELRNRWKHPCKAACRWMVPKHSGAGGHALGADAQSKNPSHIRYRNKKHNRNTSFLPFRFPFISRHILMLT